ncbi:MAG: zf-HC2 domain-containing protein [Vicinamibacterales bacterium]
MYCNQYRDAIQELADGTLGPVRRAELQTHLDQCDACRALSADLRSIRDAAAHLDTRTPGPHVWMQIAGRLRREGQVAAPSSRRHYALLAIAAALMLSVGTSLWLLLPGGGQSPSPRDVPTAGDTRGNATPGDTVQSITEDLRVAEQHYQSAIVKLEQAAKSNDGSIDAQTAAVLEKTLTVIDQAIAESRTALRTEPQSQPARDSLFDALRRKVTLLQDTIALMNEMRKGNSAGAAQILDGGGKS